MAFYETRASGKSSTSGEGSEASNNGLKPGESAFASFSPDSLHPDGEPVIAKTEDGGYRYMGSIPQWNEVTVDKQSQDYKQAKQDYNVRLSVLSDGTVKVEKGGLFERGKTFKSVKEFQKDAEKRIDSRSRFDIAEKNSLQSGRIPQIQAEYFRGVVRKNSSSMALKKMTNGITQSMQAVKARLAVADMARQKIKALG